VPALAVVRMVQPGYSPLKPLSVPVAMMPDSMPPTM
jgi:hypothetical protein